MSAPHASVDGDAWLAELVKHVKRHEAQLIGPKIGAAANSNGSNVVSAAAESVAGWATAPLSWVGLAAQPADANAKPARPRQNAPPAPTTPFVISPHHLFYLLIRFEELGLPAGSLDTRVSHPPVSRPIEFYTSDRSELTANVDTTAAPRPNDRSDTMSLATSLRSAFGASVRGSSISSASWWGTSSKPAQHDVTRDARLLYSVLTKLPALRIGSTPGVQSIAGFDHSANPGANGIPLDAFSSLTSLTTVEIDPRGLLGWDRLCIQLVELRVHQSGLEDVSDLLIEAVCDDVRRRRGDRVDAWKRRVVHSSSGGGDADKASPSPLRQELDTTPLPTVAWHFLRHLSLAQNSLTFVSEEPLAHLPNLTSLDLSCNLLNAVPPALHLLPNLASLDVSDNLIDSVLGISAALPRVRTLVLSKNRLESLCGLERLSSLARVDLRHNYVYDAGELGRLAPVASVRDVYADGNPLVDELPDWRVEVFLQFARERRRIRLDGTEPGYFEKQRIADRLDAVGRIAFPQSPETAKLARGDGSASAEATDSATSAGEQEAAVQVAAVKPVHRSRVRARRRADSTTSRLDVQGPASAQSRSGGNAGRASPAPSTDVLVSKAKARLQDTPAVSSASSLSSAVVSTGSGAAGSEAEESDYAAMSDSDAIKAAVRSGQTALAASPLITAIDGKPAETGRRPGMPKLASRAQLSRKSDPQAGVAASAVTTQVESHPEQLEIGRVDSDVDLARAVLQNLQSAPAQDSKKIADSSTPSVTGSPSHRPRTLSRTITTDENFPADAEAMRSERKARRSSTTSGVLSSQRPAEPTATLQEASATRHRAMSSVRRSPLEGPLMQSADPPEEAQAFRRGIEALKGEMGDDWLTLLAKGVYKPDGTPTLGRKSGKAAAAKASAPSKPPPS